MASKFSLIKSIGDFLENRQKINNFGTCKRCLKNVYWSATKVASHIRSGHCSGASEDEVQRFKNEFVYDSPKNLVHKSQIRKLEKSTTKDNNETQGRIKVINFKKEDNNSSSSIPRLKRAKLELNEGEDHQFIEEQNDSTDLLYEMEGGQSDDGDEKVDEIYYVTEAASYERQPIKSPRGESKVESPAGGGGGGANGKEEKFIAVVYPQFKGRSKLQLIDEILDLKRRNELLQAKVKTYENTINKLI